MNRIRIFLSALALSGLVGYKAMAMYAGTVEDRIDVWTPTYMSWKDLRSAVKGGQARTPVKRGKIGIRGNLVFLNEPNKGIHVFDNANPAAPKALAFINIPGNVDLAVRGGVLFADSFVDLVAIDISALPEVKELNRQVDVFPYDPLQAAEEDVWYYGEELDKTKGVVISWKKQARSK
jgi:hypothetical protein